LKKSNFIYFLSKYLNQHLPQHAGLSSNTRKAYSDSFKLLFIFAKEKYRLKPNKIQLETIDKTFILAFLDWIIKQRGCSDATRNLRLNHMRAFFSYIQTQIPSLALHSQNILQIPKKKTQRKVIEYITLEGIKLILSLPDTQTSIGRKHLVLLSFMFATGTRVQEVIDVTINDFKYNTSRSVKIVGKGNKARMVPLEEGMIEMLEGYLEEERAKRVFYDRDDPIFLNRSGTKLTRQGISYIVKKYSARARAIDSALIPKKVHPHLLRHSRAMALLQAGIELIYIRDFLGHYSVLTTEHYARVSNEETRKALMKVSEDTNAELPVWQQDNDLLEFLKDLGR
jgi:site-specific recombinase XerD